MFIKKVKAVLSIFLAILLITAVIPSSVFTVNAENSIESISVVAVRDLIEKSDGSYNYDVDYENGGYTPYYFIYSTYFILEYTVIYNNGEIFVANYDYELYDKFGFCPSVNTNQSYKNQWEIGKHTIDIEFMGKSCETDINIIKSPVESISAVTDKSLIELADGEYTTWDRYNNVYTEEFYYYEIYADDFEYTVTYDGGKTVTGSIDTLNNIFGNNYNPIFFRTYQTYDNQWGIGKHTIDVEFMGATCQTEIEMIENPIESINAIALRSLTENVDGYYTTDYNCETGTYTEEYFYYVTQYGWVTCFDYNIVFKNGETGRYHYFDLMYNLFDGRDIRSDVFNQNYENQWKLGLNAIEMEYLGHTFVAEIEIIENPIESISVKQIGTLIEYADGYYTNDWNVEGNPEYFEYYSPEFEYTVIYDGGNVFTGDIMDLYEKFGYDYYPSVTEKQSYENQWKVGKNITTLEYMGHSCEVEIEISESPIESITAIARSALKEEIDGYYYGEFYYSTWDCFNYTVTYDGGKIFSGNNQDLYDKFGYSVRMETNQDDVAWGLGKHEIDIRFMGATCVAEISVVETDYKSIQISGEDELTISFIKNDDTVIEAKILGFESRLLESVPHEGTLITDIGIFYSVIIHYDSDFEFGNPSYSNNVALSLGKLHSNTLENCNYYKALMRASDIYRICRDYAENTGEIINYSEKENLSVDQLSALAFSLGKRIEYEYIMENNYVINYVVKSEDIQKSIEEVFGIKEVDFSSSPNYNPETGKIIIRPTDRYSNYDKGKISFKNEEWVYTETFDGYKKVSVVLNKDLTVKSISTELCTHNYQLIYEVEADCDNNGIELYRCELCEEYKTEEFPATGHNEIFSYNKSATYTEKAANVYVCETCGKETYEYYGYALCDFDKNGRITEEDYEKFEECTEDTDIELYDFDGDGKIEKFDKTVLELLISGKNFSEMIDVNEDGQSDIRDLVRIKKNIADSSDNDNQSSKDAEDVAFVRKFVLVMDERLYKSNT